MVKLWLYRQIGRKIMKIIKVNCDEKFLFSLTELSKPLKFILGESNKVINCAQGGTGININVCNGVANLTYERDCDFVRGFTLALEHIDENKEISLKCDIERMGVMINAATHSYTVDYLKKFIRNCAMMGYNFLEVYTECNYEVPGEPFFGYKRGRYSQAELKEIVAYGKKFHIELVPCIQTLGHMKDLFKWGAYSSILDTEKSMLVNHEPTYKLIDNMLKSLAECFDTDRINLGMDEAYWMCSIRNSWIKGDYNVDVGMEFINHLKRVVEIAEKYGFKSPAIWADLLIGYYFKGYIDPPKDVYTGFPERIKKEFPHIQLNYWHYNLKDIEEFDRLIGIARELSPNVTFASEAFNLYSFCPENCLSEQLAKTAHDGCVKNNINEFLVTIWTHYSNSDNVLAGLYNFVEQCGSCSGYDFEQHFKFLYGYTYTEFKELDQPNFIDGNVPNGEGQMVNPSYYILAEDLMLGIASRHIPKDTKEKYEQLAKKLGELAKRDSEYAFLFKFEQELCEYLAIKCNLSNELKEAYDNRDMKALKKFAKFIPTLIKETEKFYDVLYDFWHGHAKPWGFERYGDYIGSQIMRFKSAKKLIEDFVKGKIEKIELLDEERLPLNKKKDGKYVNIYNWKLASSTYKD